MPIKRYCGRRHFILSRRYTLPNGFVWDQRQFSREMYEPPFYLTAMLKRIWCSNCVLPCLLEPRELHPQSSMTLHKSVAEDRQLTLDDMQGMFLLLGAGFAIAWAALASEIARYVYLQLRYGDEDGGPSLGEKIKARLSGYKEQVWMLLFAPSDSYVRFLAGNLHTHYTTSARDDDLWSYFGSVVQNADDLAPQHVSKPNLSNSMVHLKEPVTLQHRVKSA